MKCNICDHEISNVLVKAAVNDGPRVICSNCGELSSIDTNQFTGLIAQSTFRQIVFLNTSILTSYGRYKYLPLTLDEVKGFLQKNNSGLPFLSAIGHKATAEIMSLLLVSEIKVNRIEYKQNEDDVCIVFKMNSRIEEGKILSVEEIERIGYSWGLIVRI